MWRIPVVYVDVETILCGSLDVNRVCVVESKSHAEIVLRVRNLLDKDTDLPCMGRGK